MGKIVIGSGTARRWVDDASAVEKQDADLLAQARECDLYASGAERGACSLDGNLHGDAWLLVVGDHVDAATLDADHSVIAYCSTPGEPADGLTIEFERQDDGRVAVRAWRGPREGQPAIDGFYAPGSGDTAAICGATEAEAGEIERRGDAWGAGERRPMTSERTAWAEGMGLDAEAVEALTLVSEEATARDVEVHLPPGDVSAWRLALEEAGLDDLAQRAEAAVSAWEDRTA